MALPAIESVDVELSIVLGQKNLPIEQLLRMGRGAVIELTALMSDDVQIFANQTLVAFGQVQVDGDHLRVEVTEKK